MAVPRRIVDVCPATKASGVNASSAQNSGTHTESAPSRSAWRTSSTPVGPSGTAAIPIAQRHRAGLGELLDALDRASACWRRTSSSRRRSTRASLSGLAASAAVVPDGPGPSW